jgi:ferric-dicitrate binding protein FerR (iron transport regulator)
MTEELQNIDRIIIRYLLNETDEAEKLFLLNWMKEDIANQHHFFAFKATWERVNQNIPEIAKTGESWKSLRIQIQEKESVRTRKSLIPVFLKYAAAIALISVLGFTAYIISKKFSNREEPLTVTQIVTDNGQKKEITLPDGTKVWLNSGTTFSYTGNYGKNNREVSLLGEAFFDVTRDESKTFIVNAGDLTIKVLGTSFNVNCYPDNKVVETTVVSGIVSIEDDLKTEGSEIVILNKREKGTYNKDQRSMSIESTTADVNVQPLKLKKITLTEEETGYIASWKDQTLSFNNETFEEMAVKLQRWFNVTIKIEDPDLKNYRYKGRFENVRSIYQVLEVVKLATPIAYEYNEKTKEITIRELK